MDKSRNTAAVHAGAGDVAAELGVDPLDARSVVLSTLLGTHPPELPVSALVALARAFDIPAGTLRTALSRMASRGEVEAVGGRYRLAGRLLDRQREQDAGRTAPDTPWDGTWWCAVSLAGSRPVAERRRLRSAMTGARMGEVRPGVWMRPANVAVTVGRPEVAVVRGPLTGHDPRDLVGRLWDLVAAEARARQLVAVLERWTSELTADRPPDAVIAPAFTAFAACLQYLRAEPQLPAELAASPAAAALRAAYGRAEPVLQARLRELVRRTAADSARR